MKRTLLSTVVVCAYASLAIGQPELSGESSGGEASAVRDSVLWDNYPSGAGMSLYSSQLDTLYPFDSQVADDFRFDDDDHEITDVHWVGGFFDGDPVPGIPFNIYIYADDGSGTAPTGGPDDPSDTALAAYEGLVPVETPIGPDTFEYEVDLPSPFAAEMGVKYWIAIQSVVHYPPHWGIADSLDQWDAEAKQGFPLLGAPYWEDFLGVDVAFRLTGPVAEQCYFCPDGSGGTFPLPPEYADCYEAGGFPESHFACEFREQDDGDPPHCEGACGLGVRGPTGMHLFSGEKVEVIQDLRIPGRGFDFVLTRTYRSRFEDWTDQGYGWDMSYNLYFEQDGSQLAFHSGDLRRDAFSEYPDGSYRRGEFLRVVNIEVDGTIIMRHNDGALWTFAPLDDPDTPGRIVEMRDRNENLMTFEYDAQGRLWKVRDTLNVPGVDNRVITFEYNADGFLSDVTDFAGRVVHYEYYHDGEAGGSDWDLKSVTYPAVVGTPTGNDFPSGKTWTYRYSPHELDPRLKHNLYSITDGKGQEYAVITYEHEDASPDFDRVIRQELGGTVIDYVYEEQTPVPENGFAVLRTIINDGVGNVEHRYFDAGHRLALRQEYTGRAAPDQPTTGTSNRPGNRLRGDDPEYFETRNVWDTNSQHTYLKSSEGDSVLNIMDSSAESPLSWGNVLVRETRRWPGDPDPITESFEYLPDLGGGCCSGSGFITRWADARGNVTSNGFDDHGNRILTRHRIPSIVEEWEYNEFGQMTAHILPENDSGYRRRDEQQYYESGPQMGYLREVVVDAGGLHLTTRYEYDAVGNVTRVIDPRGHDTQYVVNKLNQVVREIAPEVTDGSGVRYQRDTYYDANDNVARIDVQNIDDQGSLQPNDHYTTVFEYEILNHIVRECAESGEYVGEIPGPPELPICDGLPEDQFVTTEYAYDANRNRTLIRYGEATRGQDPDNVVETVYDERNLMLEQIRAPDSAIESITQFEYDDNHNLTRWTGGATSPGERIHTFQYDALNRLTRSVDPEGNETTYGYDDSGNGILERVEGELIDGESSDNVLLSRTERVYDEMNRPIETRVAFFNPASGESTGDGWSTTRTHYDPASNVVRTEDDRGHGVNITYDQAYRRRVITDEKGSTVTYAYDSNSNVIAVTRAEVSDVGEPDETLVTSYGYDNLDRLIRIVDNAGQTHSFASDSRGNQSLTIDALNRETRYRHDGLSRLLQTVSDMNANGADVGDPEDIVTTQSWDDSSRLTGRTDNNGNVTAYAYDGLNRQTAITYADETRRSYGYDVHDNRISSTDANGTVVGYTYDHLNRLTNKSITPGPDVSADTTFEVYKYDGQSRPVHAEDDDSLLIRSYDSLSNVLEETVNGRSIVSAYDGAANRLSCTYPGQGPGTGRQIDYTYDALNRVATITEGGELIAEYDYLGPIRVERRTYGNSTEFNCTYDDVERVISTAHVFDPDGADIVIDERSYTWDAMSNKTQRAELRLGGPNLTHNYTYDAVSRLLRSTATDGDGAVVRDTGYNLDGVGNRTTVTGQPNPGDYFLDATLPVPADFQVNQYTFIPSGRRTYDDNGNLTSIAATGDCNGDGHVDLGDYGGENGFAACLNGPDVPVAPECACYDLDDSGRVDLGDFARFQQRITETEAAVGAAIAYDYRNQMVEFSDARAGQRHAYAYDALGRRMAKTVDAGGAANETRYFYIGGQVVEEQDNTGATQATYVYGNHVDEVLSMQRGGEDLYYHSDDMYNVMAVTDADGAVVERYEYGDYGQPSFPVAFEDYTESPDDWSFLGDAYYEATEQSARLAARGELLRAGAVFFSPAGYEVDDFEVEFDFVIAHLAGTYLDESGLTGPDGLAFVVNGAIPTEPGGFGVDLGYGGFPADSFAVEFDSFHNDFDPDSNHVGIDVGGSVDSIATAGVSPDFEETGTWHALVRFDGGVVNVILTPPGQGALAVLSASIPSENIPAVKYFGFTAGTGLNSGDTDVDNVQIRLLNSASGNPYMFTGRRYDPETGLYYYRTRYLDPIAGRFTTRDIIGIWGDTANLGNAYSYVANNPWTRADPLGLWGIPSIGGPFVDIAKKVAETVKDVAERAADEAVAKAQQAKATLVSTPCYGRYCGPSNICGVGSGTAIDDLDRACEKHDKCYGDCGGSGTSGLLSYKNDCLRKCDQDLCDDAKAAKCGTNINCQWYRAGVLSIFCGRWRISQVAGTVEATARKAAQVAKSAAEKAKKEAEKAKDEAEKKARDLRDKAVAAAQKVADGVQKAAKKGKEVVEELLRKIPLWP